MTKINSKLKRKRNSKAKGKRGELDFIHLLRDEFGIKAERTNQYCGNSGKADDIVIDNISNFFHIEIKRREKKLSIFGAYEQAKNDNKDINKIPIVLHRKDRGEWLITLLNDDYMKLMNGNDILCFMDFTINTKDTAKIYDLFKTAGEHYLFPFIRIENKEHIKLLTFHARLFFTLLNNLKTTKWNNPNGS